MVGNPADPQSVKQITPDKLPEDAVAVLVWREGVEDTLTMIVSKASWLKNYQIVKKHGQFLPDHVYEFESEQNANGRKSVFQIQDVKSWGANIHSPIIQVAKPPKLVT